MKILVLSAVGLVALNIGDHICALKRISLLVLQVSHMVLASQQIVSILSICWLFAMNFHEYFADFDWVFCVSDERGTYNVRKSYDLDSKLNLTLTALLRKVQILSRIVKKYSAISACA